MPNAPRFAALRLTVAILSVLGLLAAAYFWQDANQARAAFDQWLVDEPMRTRIDLSTIGAVTTPFRQTCASAHAQNIELLVEPPDDATAVTRDSPPPSTPTAPIHLAGLHLTIDITDPDGVPISAIDLRGEDVYPSPSPVPLVRFLPIATGEYIAHIRVLAPAPALADRTQTLVARYEICGLELLPALLMRVTAIGIAVIVGVATLCTLPGLIRHGLYRKP